MKVFIMYFLALLCISNCITQEVMDEQNRFYIVGNALREAARLEDKQMKRLGNNYQEIIENWYLVKAYQALTDAPSLIHSSSVFGWGVASLLFTYTGNPTIINFLLNAGVSAAPADGGSPLDYIPLHKEIPDRYIMQSVQRLLDAGADVNYVQHLGYKKTPLMYMVERVAPSNANLFLNIVKLFLSKNIITQPTSYFSLLPSDLRSHIQSRYSILAVDASDGWLTVRVMIKGKKKEFKDKRKKTTDAGSKKELKNASHALQNALDLLKRYQVSKS